MTAISEHSGPAKAFRRDLTPWLALAVLASLPTIGLFSGPAYAPLVFGLATVVLVLRVVARQPLPRLDRALVYLAAGFVALCWVSTLWSINPHQSLRGSLQVSLIVLAAVVFVSLRDELGTDVRRIFAVLVIGIAAGTLVMTADMLSQYALTTLHFGWSSPGQPHKYNRGLNYLVLITWPVLAYLVWQGRTGAALAIGLLVAAPVILGLSGSARTAGVAGLAVLLAGFWSRRLLPLAVTSVAVLLPVSLPFALRAFSEFRGAVAAHIPSSGLHRLEIWDYMGLRIMERPLLGWGFSSSKSLPVSAQELHGYQWADGAGIHAHNQWIELWVGLGAVGMVIGVLFILLVTRRIARLPERLRPFAYAAFASVMACSLVNYEVSTDSWWAALAATALLFTLLSKAMALGTAPVAAASSGGRGAHSRSA